MKTRRAAMVVTGLAMAASLGLAGAGLASASAPALKIKPHSTWTLELGGGSTGCEVETFNTITHHWTSDAASDKGTWSGGGSTISMVWKKGANAGLTFSGTFATSPAKEYTGSFGGSVVGLTGQLVKGAVSGC
jgi:hypothetical protein